MGKLVAILLLVSAVLAGAGIWYTNTRAFYAPVEGPVTLTLSAGGDLTVLPARDVQAVASTSSPLGFRACFTHDLDLDALRFDVPETAAPTIAPPWFDCFDAEAVAALLASGEARAAVAYENVAYGVDRIVALTADRGWAWHQLNDCGEKAYDGTVVGEACPDRDTFQPLIEGSL
ncbi:DUF6446 family protein [Jannaschia seohaensis]|uniref:Histidine kinase n=1 Tax=Jannaschia seohaensis TaxID=475081 RepID=A0A2Y9AXP6_9RHOB|nr:DUF6446 family protein [Jannaschia seohaensis]PWJ18314.1 hypothetical protein BCF38_105303 [Jannaschia seohaensis]SSA46839.1 hypothetical protein SAMN05421539_105303 [Jannaschia seohaensis]